MRDVTWAQRIVVILPHQYRADSRNHENNNSTRPTAAAAAAARMGGTYNACTICARCENTMSVID